MKSVGEELHSLSQNPLPDSAVPQKMIVVHFQKRDSHARSPERFHQFHRLVDRHIAIARSIHNQKRRGTRLYLKDRRNVAPDCRRLGRCPAKERGEQGIAIGVMVREVKSLTPLRSTTACTLLETEEAAESVESVRSSNAANWPPDECP